MSISALPSPRRALVVCCHSAATVVTCAALLSAAVLVPAPWVVLPMIVAVCIGLPMIVMLELSVAVAVLRATRGGALRRRHLTRLRSELRRLPETRHPLDL